MPAPRFIRGLTSPVIAPVATATALAVGDLVGLSSGNVVRASATTWTTDLATTQTAFVNTFLGVAASRKDANVARVHGYSQDNRVRVSAGIWEFDCASASFAVGALVGPAKAAGDALLDDLVVSVANIGLAIGRVVEATTSSTRVRVEVLPVLHPIAR